MTAEPLPSIANRVPCPLLKSLFILLLTLTGFAVMGYHPGLEDDGVYLSAVKARLDPALYPHDADFVRLQMQATLFDEFVSGFVRITHIAVPWTELLWQLLSLYTILWAAHGIAQMLFPQRSAAWGGTALLSALLTLPVAGTALNIADQHLHPRNMATGLILMGVERMLAGRKWQAMGWIIIALMMHPIMAMFGMSFCIFLGLAQKESVSEWLARRTLWRSNQRVAAAFPLAWVFEPPTMEWRCALETRTYYFLHRWTWYEWLGAVGPPVLFGLLWLWKMAGRRSSMANAGIDRADRRGGTEAVPIGNSVCAGPLPGFALAVLLYALFQQAAAMVMLGVPVLVRLTPLQPMRYLHIEYVFLVLIAGGLLGRHVLGRKLWRWSLLLVAVNGGMFVAQRVLLPASEHLELPGRPSRNAWLQAFAWIRQNTPKDAFFALDPNYLASPGEDFHSFRALAERSQLADALKDAAVVTQVPELAPRWVTQVDAQAGWDSFNAGDLKRLKDRFGVNWVLLPYPAPPRLICIWHNDLLAVCPIGGEEPAPGL